MLSYLDKVERTLRGARRGRPQNLLSHKKGAVGSVSSDAPYSVASGRPLPLHLPSSYPWFPCARSELNEFF